MVNSGGAIRRWWHISHFIVVWPPPFSLTNHGGPLGRSPGTGQAGLWPCAIGQYIVCVGICLHHLDLLSCDPSQKIHPFLFMVIIIPKTCIFGLHITFCDNFYWMYVKSMLDKICASNHHSNPLHNNKEKKNNLFLNVKVVHHGPSEEYALKCLRNNSLHASNLDLLLGISIHGNKNITCMNNVFAYQ